MVSAVLAAMSLAACGRASAPSASSYPTSVTTLPVGALQTTVSDFAISQTDSQITVNQIKLGSTAAGRIEFSGSAVVLKKNFAFDLKGEIGKD